MNGLSSRERKKLTGRRIKAEEGKERNQNQRGGEREREISYPNSRLAIFEGPGRSIHTLFHLKLKREDEDRVEGRSERWTSKSIEGR